MTADDRDWLSIVAAFTAVCIVALAATYLATTPAYGEAYYEKGDCHSHHP